MEAYVHCTSAGPGDRVDTGTQLCLGASSAPARGAAGASAPSCPRAKPEEGRGEGSRALRAVHAGRRRSPPRRRQAGQGTRARGRRLPRAPPPLHTAPGTNMVRTPPPRGTHGSGVDGTSPRVRALCRSRSMHGRRDPAARPQPPRPQGVSAACGRLSPAAPRETSGSAVP